MKNTTITVRVIVTATTSLAVVLAAELALRTPTSLQLVDAYFAIVLVAMIAGAARFPLQLQRSRVVMDTAPTMAAIILLDPLAAMAVCVAGKGLGQWTRPVPNVRRVFNTAAFGCQVAAAAWLRLRLGEGAFPGPSQIEAVQIVAAGVVLYGLNALMTEAVLSADQHRRFGAAWWTNHRDDLQHQGALLILGGFAALTAEGRPWVLPALLVPTAVIYRAWQAHHQRLAQAEAGQAQAERERERLARIIDATPDFVGTFDPEGTVLYLNESGRRMLGLGPDAEVARLQAEGLFKGWDAAYDAALADLSWDGESVLVTGPADIPVSQVVVGHKTPDGRLEFLSTIARDISERKKLEDQLRHIASHDGLTGLINRGRFEEVSKRHLEFSRANGKKAALLVLDLDGFKDVNDTMGHQVGDRVLIEVAHAVQGVLRVRDRNFARLGGDEFAVVIADATVEDAQIVMDRIRAAVRSVRVEAGGRVANVDASIGAAVFPDEGTTLSELLAAADSRMYETKHRRARETRKAS